MGCLQLLADGEVVPLAVQVPPLCAALDDDAVLVAVVVGLVACPVGGGRHLSRTQPDVLTLHLKVHQTQPCHVGCSI